MLDRVPPPLSRRSLLAATASASLLAGCGRTTSSPPSADASDDEPSGAQRMYYGSDRDNQFGDLYLPTQPPVGVAVLVHGGFWLDQYGLDLMVPMAQVLLADGWAVWNLEYRRLGNGGGWPATFEDAAVGIDHLTELAPKYEGVDLDKVVVLGHSAGGHLAAWAASRSAETPGGAPKVTIRGVVSLAGALDLLDGEKQGLGGGTIDQLLGGTPAQVPDHYRLGDPAQLVPASCPVAVVRGSKDTTVPRSQATDYLAAAKAAHAPVSFTELGGDHFTIIDPTAASWPAISKILRRQAG